VLRLGVFTALGWLFATVGLQTFSTSAGFSLVWPLPGLAFLWLLTSTRATYLLDLAGLALVSALPVYVELDSISLTVTAVVQTLVQPVVAVLLLRRFAPSLWHDDEVSPPSRIAEVGTLLAAVVAGAGAAALVRVSGLGLVPLGGRLDLLTIFVRNLSWMLAIGCLGLMLLPTMRRLTRRHHADPGDGSVPVLTGRQVAELAALAVATGVTLDLVFFAEPPVPLSFLLLLTSVWSAMRFPPALAMVQPVVAGSIAVLATLEGDGIFVASSGPVTAALLAHSLLLAMSITTLALTVGNTERRTTAAAALRAEKLADERAGLLTAVIEGLREGVVVLQADGVEAVRNPAGREILKLPPGRPYDEAMPGPHFGMFEPGGRRLESHDLPHARALQGQDSPAADFFVRTPQNPDGQIIEIMATHLDPGPGGVARAVVNFRDVTGERQERDTLASFAGVIAHDLNNPLSIVTGWTEQLSMAFGEGPVDPDEGLDMTRRISHAAAHMGAFIDDLLTFTVARDQPLRMADVDLSEVTESVASMRRDRDNRPRIEVQPGLRVRADPGLVRQVMDNLVSNGSKYVGPGVRPHIVVAGEPVEAMMRITVTDNGIGVPPEMRRRIFENFQRAHSLEYTGTGIGLAIARRVVERHGGRISVNENPAGGSIFTLTLPAASGAE